MYGMYGGFDSTYLLVLAAMLLGLWAQSRVQRTYAKYAAIPTQRGEMANTLVDDLLRRNGNQVVTVRRVAGQLTDHYDPRDESLSLSDGVYHSSSIAAIGIAAHEAGHAMQKLTGYRLMALRSALVPAANIGSQAAVPLFIAGLIFAWRPLMTLGIFAFALAVLFSLVTLPVELDASRRAMTMLRDGGYLTGDELAGVRKVLNAAAMTYVAAAVGSLANLLRLVLIARRRDD